MQRINEQQTIPDVADLLHNIISCLLSESGETLDVLG